MHKSPPKHKQAEIWFIRGLTARDQGNLQEAANAYRKTLQLNPNHLKATYNLAILNHDLGELDQARSGYLKAIELKPTLAEAYKNLADLYFNQKNTTAAVSSYKQALIVNPQYAEAWHNLGLLQRQLDQLDNAFTAYCKAIELRPDYTSALHGLTALSKQIGKTAETTIFLTDIALTDPTNISIRLCLSEIFLNDNQITKALTKLQEIKTLDPQNSEALNLSGLIHLQMGDVENALSSFTAAHKINPQSAKIHSNLLYTLLMNPESGIETYKQALDNWWKLQSNTITGFPTYKHNRPSKSEQPLRLAFISADFCRHSISYFLLLLIKNLATDRFKIYCYSDTGKTDDYTLEIKKHIAKWHSIYGLEHRTVADLINHDQIDILVELSGHTSNNRLPAVAMQPAPLQFSWLGYPASSGITSGT
ncbi:MAG: tetratricopeptide repeat protein, partial [Candidatus Aegiribacteria sp.]|nr:tetratricopeptide repeat protein [Candidatus Aegiribacteria sp.]